MNRPAISLTGNISGLMLHKKLNIVVADFIALTAFEAPFLLVFHEGYCTDWSNGWYDKEWMWKKGGMFKKRIDKWFEEWANKRCTDIGWTDEGELIRGGLIKDVLEEQDKTAICIYRRNHWLCCTTFQTFSLQGRLFTERWIELYAIFFWLRTNILSESFIRYLPIILGW